MVEEQPTLTTLEAEPLPPPIPSSVAGSIACRVGSLSPYWEYRIKIVVHSDETALVHVYRLDGSTSVAVDSIVVETDVENGLLVDCDRVRSYFTGYHTDLPIQDKDYGGLIVADFNFDGQEDVAVLRQFWSNAGPVYHFYTQNHQQHWERDDYLSDSVRFFPDTFAAEAKQLISTVRAHAGLDLRSTYQYYPRTQQWKCLKTEEIEG